MTRAMTQHDARWTLRARRAWATRFARLISGHELELCSLMEAEVHKPRWEAVTNDLTPLINACRWHAKRAGRVLGSRRVRGGGILTFGQRQREVRVPLGTVGIIATWNYPVNLLGQHLVQAVVAGNRVVVKPSERSPRTQRRLCELVIEAGLPVGYLTVLDHARETGASLVSGDAAGPLDHLVFTGSTEVGTKIAEVLAPTLTTSTLELSGRDSALVLDDADPVLAARSIWFAATINAGQSCMAPRRVLVHESVYPAFCTALAPLASRSEPRRMIDEEAAGLVDGLVADAIARGGRSVSGIHEPATDDRVRPMAVISCPPEAPLVEGRHFGPALAVVRCRSVEEMLEIHSSCDQKLVTSVFTSRLARARALAPRLDSVTVTVNDAIIPTAHPASSIGGTGPSGWGVTQGARGLESLTRPVFVSVTSNRIRPPTEAPDGATRAKLIPWMLRLAGGGKRTIHATTDRRGGSGPRPTQAVEGATR